MSQLLKITLSRVLRSSLNCAHICSLSLQTPSSGIDGSQQTDLVMQKIQTCASPNQLLNIASRDLTIMNERHLIQVLSSLYELQKHSHQPNNTRDIINNPTFGTICEKLKKKARTLDPSDCVEAVKYLSYLQVPISSVIQQTMLQLIRYNINDFNVKQIIFLDFILSKYYDTRNHLVDALLLALPLVFQIHMPLEIDHDDPKLMADMLSYACKHELPDRCVNNIVTGLLMHEEKLDYRIAYTIAYSLTSISPKEEFFPTKVKLLHACFDVLAKDMLHFPLNFVANLVGRLKHQIHDKQNAIFYDEIIFDAFADYVVSKRLNLVSSLIIARNIAKCRHTNKALVNYLVEMAYQDPSSLESASPNMVFSFIHCLEIASYQPDSIRWETIAQAISHNALFNMDNMRFPYSKFGNEMASLGYYNLDFLTKFFDERNLSTYLDRANNTLDYMQILILHEAAKHFCPGFEIPLPEPIRREAIEKYPYSQSFSYIEQFLTHGLGGEFFARNVQLPSGIIADNIVAVDNGNLVSFPGLKRKDQEKVRLEELNIPKSAHIMCILRFNSVCYSANEGHLRGQFRIVLDVVEAQGYSVLEVNMHSLMQMPESERGPYLMRQIRDKCAEAGRSFNES